MKYINVRISFLLIVCVIPMGAMANDVSRAKEAFKQGQKLFEADRFEEASLAFTEAMEAAPNWKLHYNIAQCEAAARKYGSALDHFEKYIAKGGDDIPNERMEEVLNETARLRQMVGTVTFAAIPEGAELTIDGEARGTFPLAGQIRLAVGVEHDVRITRNGDELLRRKLVLGATQVIQLEIEQSLVGPSEQTAASSDGTRAEETDAAAKATPENSNGASPGSDHSLAPLKVVFWISVPMVLGGVGMGIGFLVAANGAVSDFNARNNMVKTGEIPSDDAELLQLQDDVNTFDTVSLVSFIGAGVFATTAIITGIVYLVKKKRLRDVTLSPMSMAVRF